MLVINISIDMIFVFYMSPFKKDIATKRTLPLRNKQSSLADFLIPGVIDWLKWWKDLLTISLYHNRETNRNMTIILLLCLFSIQQCKSQTLNDLKTWKVSTTWQSPETWGDWNTTSATCSSDFEIKTDLNSCTMFEHWWGPRLRGKMFSKGSRLKGKLSSWRQLELDKASRGL